MCVREREREGESGEREWRESVDSPKGETAVLLPELAADDLTELVELDGVEYSHCPCGGRER